MLKCLMLRGLLVTVLLPAAVCAKPLPAQPLVKKVKPNVVVVKPYYKPSHRAPVHRHYKIHSVPKTAAYIVLGGVTYAVIDNLYYERRGDTYIYVETPPVAANDMPVSVESSQALKIGSIVDSLPSNTTVVTVNGASYYVKGQQWFAPIAGSHRFVVVESQL